MSSLLPMKESSREVVVEVARTLQPWFPEITAAWRQQMFNEFNFDGRAMAALERLTIGTGFSIFSQTDFATFYSNLQHFGERLAKLEVSARAVARSLEIYQQLIDPYLRKTFPPSRLPEMSAAMETLSWATYVAVSAAHSDAQKIEAETLLAVLDAELSASNLDVLLDRVLRTATFTFNASLGLILMCEGEQQLLRIESHFGFSDGDELLAETTPVGEGFAGKIALYRRACYFAGPARHRGPWAASGAKGARAGAVGCAASLERACDRGAGYRLLASARLAADGA